MSTTTMQIDHQRLFETLPGLYVVLSPELTALAATDDYLRVTMVRREDIIGHYIFDVFPENPDDRNSHDEQVRASILEVFETGKPSEVPLIKYDVRDRASGSEAYEERYWRLKTFPVFDDSGKVAYAIHRIEDMTEHVLLRQKGIEQEKRHAELVERFEESETARQQTAEELEEARLRLEAALQAGEIGTWTWDPVRDIVTADRNLAEFFGVSKEDAAGGKIEKYLAAIHPEDVGHVQKAISEALENGQSYLAEYRIVKPDEPMRWVVARGRILRDEQGKPIQLPGVVIDITERKRSEEILLESEQRLKFTLSAGQLGSFELDLESGQIACSDKCREIFALPSGVEMSYDEHLSMIHDEDRDRVAAAIENAVSAGTDYKAEYRITRADGEPAWIFVGGRCLYDKNGKPLVMNGVMLDITSRKKSEADLLESQTRLALALQTGRAGTFEWDIKNDVNIWSPEIEKMYGIPVGGFEGNFEAWRKRVVAEDGERVAEGIRRALANKDEYNDFEFRAVLPDKSIRWFSGRVRMFYDEAGEPDKMIGINIDITELKRAQEMLIERTDLALMSGKIGEAINQRKPLREVLKKCTDAMVEYMDVAFARIWTLDRNEKFLKLQASSGMYTHIDGAHSRIPVGQYKIGRIAEEKKPHLTNEVMTDPQVSDKEWARRENMIAFAGYPLVVEDRLVGVMCVFAQRVLTDATMQAMEAIANTISNGIERKQVEEERKKLLASEQELRRQAEKANRMKDEFLATLSHELRTPLSAILGWSRMLSQDNLAEDQKKRAVEVIERNARTQAQLIDDVLDVSRIISGKLRLEVQPVELSGIVDTAVESMRPAAEAKNIRLQKIADTDAMISGDPDRLQQIIWNLLSNAVKFTPRGGRVRVRLERINSHVELVVEDTGIGIDPETLPYVFERFRQSDSSTTRKHGGLGLGLAIVRHLVELHGGTVQASSEGTDRGAAFTVKFPLMALRPSGVKLSRAEMPDDALRQSEDSIPFECLPEIGGLRILLVDDEADTRDILQFIFSRCKAEVETAGSVEEALDAFSRADFDVLISDIGMPERDGFDLIRSVRQMPDDRKRNISAVALTAYARLEDRMKVLSAGFQMHVPKPVEPAELLAVVASLARRNS